MAASFALALGACTSVYTTPPARTASAQLLVSTAADRAADKLAEAIPPNEVVYLDASALDGPDGRYAADAVQDRLLRRHIRVVTKPEDADVVLILRSGALSTDEDTTLVGVPQFAVPFFPVGNFITLPEIDIFKETRARGVAQFAVTGFDRRSHQLVVSVDPQYGFSHKTQWVILLLFTWSRNDLMPDSARLEEANDKSQWYTSTPIRYLPIHAGHSENQKNKHKN